MRNVIGTRLIHTHTTALIPLGANMYVWQWWSEYVGDSIMNMYHSGNSSSSPDMLVNIYIHKIWVISDMLLYTVITEAGENLYNIHENPLKWKPVKDLGHLFIKNV